MPPHGLDKGVSDRPSRDTERHERLQISHSNALKSQYFDELSRDLCSCWDGECPLHWLEKTHSCDGWCYMVATDLH